ncbi:hypothetical protein Q73A0000_03665 [Kaistella flava (ex Peng et al. 2021)]|uniref:DUF4252 domain-containing protein n=1 Tax=Kaistella flava (ex Peng et al. 2021) TaxID=2038776 RepID=A0A7M2Y7D6_9FLAO|nr:hypothetical protein [Kaistella flava (ex Peng et al. 2021)]QOW09525.1 hypothetical protein Q73A0000_03665 [Kaistella flava (ex Peng et al. 2021)]
MKKLSLLTGILVLFFMTSCRDIVNAVLDVLPPFDVPFSTNVDVPFASVSTTTYTRTPEIPMNIDLNAKIKENNPNFSINNLKSVKLNTLSLDYISSQLGNKLDVIKNARIYVKSPNQADRLIATAYNNTNPNTITFTLEDTEILEYFRTNQNSLIIEIQASRITADQIKMNMNAGFKIKVQL